MVKTPFLTFVINIVHQKVKAIMKIHTHKKYFVTKPNSDAGQKLKKTQTQIHSSKKIRRGCWGESAACSTVAYLYK